jgi:hypothetical protein
MNGRFGTQTAEHRRLGEARDKGIAWKMWGPYLSERQWGTVREDYSDGGDAWNYFTHDQARSRAYRWGEDGIAGISDSHQRLCFAVALWNGKDPILKERLFGLTNSEGNHGEDVKEYYFYLDSTPTHSYMKYLYKYPQAAFPYGDLVATNRQRSRKDMEYELLDTGIFSQDRYFDVFVEYAKAAPDDLLIKISLCNRGPDPARLHVLPTLWFRNTWSLREGFLKPVLEAAKGAGRSVVRASHGDALLPDPLGDFYLYCDGNMALLFCDNETNQARIAGAPNVAPYPKDAINDYIVQGRRDAVNPAQTGTKASAHSELTVGPRETRTIRLRLAVRPPGKIGDPFGDFDAQFKQRLEEANDFYRSVTPPSASPDRANVMRQALAGMLWGKQYYSFDADRWLDEHGANPRRGGDRLSRNRDWFHMVNDHVISMPDKWEYPWYAAWDLAFHTVALGIVDQDFAKQQLELMLSEAYIHPNGQIPAYEWNFSDVNPPVHAWATLYMHRTALGRGAEPDIDFLKSAFSKLLLNFTWWVNRKDRFGRNVFEGGFLGLDNIGVFDRSAPLPTGGYLEQADGTAWMALFCQNMAELAIEIAAYDPSFDDMVAKFVEHLLWIAMALNRVGQEGMWDEEDGFYYDLLRLPNGSTTRLKVRSMVGLLPLCATTVIEKWQRERVPRAIESLYRRSRQMPELKTFLHPTGPGHFGVDDRGILALLTPERLRRVLTRLLDEEEFLSPCGIRSLSKFHAKSPYVFRVDGNEHRVDYLPAESDSGMFGGNSNWRGPVWLPVNALIIRALLNFYLFYGDNFRIECPTGSGREMNLFEVAKEIGDRLTRIFLRDESGRRPVYGGTEKFQTDPHWRDNILFYEYFHGDNGAGLGASHQTGWTGLVAGLVHLFGLLDPKTVLTGGKVAAAAPGAARR